CDLLENQALGELTGNDPRLVAVAGFQQGSIIRHDETALILGGLMATLAMLLKNGPNLAVIADCLCRIFVFFLWRSCTRSQRQKVQTENRYERMACFGGPSMTKRQGETHSRPRKHGTLIRNL